MNAQVLQITPEKALEMLKGNTINRPQHKKYVDGLASQMKAGNWMLTGEPIIVSLEGILLDGQHRLEAVVKAGIPVEFYVIRGVQKESFRYIDTGKKRSASDLLHIEGIQNTKKMASIAQSIISYEKGNLSSTGGTSGINFDDKVRIKMTNSDILDYVKKNERLLKNCTLFAQNCYVKFNTLRIPEYGLFYYLFGNIDESDAKSFLNKLSSGSNLEDGSAILTLRNKLIDAKVNRRPFTPKVKLGMIFKCWNLFRQGRVKGKIYFDITEELPTLL